MFSIPFEKKEVKRSLERREEGARGESAYPWWDYPLLIY
jgi:hypothetical protein